MIPGTVSSIKCKHDDNNNNIGGFMDIYMNDDAS